MVNLGIDIKLTRRDLFKYSAAVGMLKLLPDYSAIAQPNWQFEKTYRFEGMVILPSIFLPDFPVSATWEIKKSNESYHSKLKISRPEKSRYPYYSHTSIGKVGNERLLPVKSIIYLNPPSPFHILYRRRTATLDFKYPNGKLSEIGITEEKYAPYNKGARTLEANEKYASGSDFLTAIVQTLIQVRDGKNPERISIIGSKGDLGTAIISISEEKAVIKMEDKDFYFKSAEIGLNGDKDPITIAISKFLSIADIKGRNTELNFIAPSDSAR